MRRPRYFYRPVRAVKKLRLYVFIPIFLLTYRRSLPTHFFSFFVKLNSFSVLLGVSYVKFSKMSEAALAVENMNGVALESNPRPLKVIIANRCSIIDIFVSCHVPRCLIQLRLFHLVAKKVRGKTMI